MNVTLPNGKVIKNVPAGTTKEQVKQKAIAAGLATEDDFGAQPAQQPNQQQAIDQLAQKQSGFETALISAGKGFADILRGVGLMDEADDAERRAFDALKKARPITSTVGEIAGQALPFAVAGGPIVAGIGGTGGRIATSAALGAAEGGIIASGTGEDVGEGILKGAAFGAGGQAIGEGIDVARRLVGGQQPVNQAVEYAASRGLPITTTDVLPPESALGRGVRTIGEQVPFVGTSNTRSAQQAARASEIESLKQIYPEVTDEEIYKAVISSGNKYKQAVSNRYDSIANAMGDAEIPINKTMSAIDEEIAQLTKGGRIQDRATIAQLESIKADLSSGAQTFKGMRDNRTFVREALKSERPSTQADRVIDRVYAAMTDDISEAVSKQAGPEAAAKLKQVDQLFAAEKSAQKKTKLRNILSKGDVKPEEATKALFSSDLSDVKQVYASIDNKGRSIARAAIVNKFIQAAGDNTSPEKFISAMDRYDKQFGVFFKGAERKQLQGLKEYLNATRRAGQSQLDPATGQKLIPFLSVGGVADFSTTGGAATGATLSIAALSRAYESAPVRSAMLRLANTPKGGEAYQKAVNAVNSAMIAAERQGEQDD